MTKKKGRRKKSYKKKYNSSGKKRVRHINKKTGIEHPWGTPEYRKAYNSLYYYTGRDKERRRKTLERRWKKRFTRKFIFEHNDEFYMTSKIAAEQLPIKAETLKCYVKWGIVPKPLYYRTDVHCITYGHGPYVGYFSQTQVELMKKVFYKTKKKKLSRDEASRWLYENWTKYEKNLGGFGNDGVYEKRGNN